jgi:hypothetical protein
MKLKSNVTKIEDIIKIQGGIVWKENSSHEIQFFSQLKKTWGFSYFLLARGLPRLWSNYKGFRELHKAYTKDFLG